MPKTKLELLVSRYQDAKDKGQLQNSSEATMRTWIDELLSIFGWDVQNTQQVLTEHSLGKEEKQKLHQIGSTNSRPDYSLVNGSVVIAFVDAKSLAVNIEIDKEVAFQIRSYGWSIGAPFSIVTNFEQIAIYDCSTMPCVTDDAAYSRQYFFTVDKFIANFEILRSFLLRENVLTEKIKFISKKGNALDEQFASLLGTIRINIANAILDSNDVNDIETLSYYVQTIINRILFIRVCEARGLEEDGLLKKFCTKDFWSEFKNCSYFEFYEHYDGPMFKKIPPLQSLLINNVPLIDFVRNLYYPSPYKFDVIPLKTLSDIYDLFLGYQLIVRNGIVTDELRSEFKKSNGAITTPFLLVDQVIQSTIPNSKIKNIPLGDVLNLKFIDIACGSGVFLVGIYDYLVRCIEEKIKRGESFHEDFFVIIDGKVKLNVKGRKAIIQNCIYGVDINPEAVEVAKLSLSLKLIDDYDAKDFGCVGLLGSQILKGIGSNIKCGNSLVEANIEEVCPNISNDIEELKTTNSFDWEASYPEVFANNGFDFVIGNPPYVEVKNYNTKLPSMAEYIKRIYSSSKNGKIDLAIPFIEKGINLLNCKGRLGYIVQKRFFKDQYGKGIRKLLTKQSSFLLNGIYDYEETDLFPGRTTYVAILVCDKDTTNNSNVWYMNSVDNNKNQLLSSKSFSDTPWNFESAQLSALRLKLTEKLGILKDICNVKVGVQVLWNNAFQIAVDKIEENLIYGHSVIDKEIVIEYNSCKPLLCNEQFAPLTKRKYTTFALFPYTVTEDGEVSEIPFSKFCESYPRAGAYLSKHKALICENVEILPQKNKEYNEKEHWHLFTRANNHGAIYKKLCIPMTAQYPQASVVLDNHVYCDNANMFFIQIENVDNTRLYALAGIINSTIFNIFARSIANPQRGGYYKFNKQFLDPVPVPRQAFCECNRDIKKLAGIAKRIEDTNEEIRNCPWGQVSGLKLSLNRLWYQLDEICFKLYGIKDKKEKAILNSIVRKDRNPYGQES